MTFPFVARERVPMMQEQGADDYDFVGAFAVATLLCRLAVVTLALKTLLEMLQPQSRRVGH